MPMLRLGNDRLDQIGDGHDVVHAIVDEIDLAVAVKLAHDRPLDHLAVKSGDPRFDRLAVRRRSFEIGDVADTQKAHMQRARNRRGGEGQDVDRATQALQPLFVFDAEALLLIDNHQAEVFEGDVFLKNAMGADQDIDTAGGGALQNVADFRLGAEAVDGLDRERKLGHAGRKAAVVLLG